MASGPGAISMTSARGSIPESASTGPARRFARARCRLVTWPVSPRRYGAIQLIRAQADAEAHTDAPAMGGENRKLRERIVGMPLAPSAPQEGIGLRGVVEERVTPPPQGSHDLHSLGKRRRISEIALDDAELGTHAIALRLPPRHRAISSKLVAHLQVRVVVARKLSELPGRLAAEDIQADGAPHLVSEAVAQFCVDEVVVVTYVAQYER